MRYAIVQSGGKQYRAVEGETIEVDRIMFDVGKKLNMEDILLVSDGENVVIGAPIISDANVAATIVDQFKGPKVIIFKYHPRKRYRLKRGHRQFYTRLMIESVEAAGLPKAAPVKKEKPKTAKAEKQKAVKASPTKKETAKAVPAKKESTKSESPSTRRKLSGFEIAEKTVELLEGAGISTVSQLLKNLAEGDDEVLAIKGLGPKALEEIKKLLKKEGYSLP